MAILVYGDVMLDEWRIGSVDRISPEAPVPVLVETGYKRNVGGAGNLAVNLASINGEVDLYGPLGNDKQGFAFLDLIKDTKVNSYLSSCMEATTSKVRIVSTQGQQICDHDRGLGETRQNQRTPRRGLPGGAVGRRLTDGKWLRLGERICPAA